ncbi:sulfurtransferase complex subunit TusB [Enterovibrio makurazakiensis]|uniref:Sulfurtransferase complex subunit TusB n=1 Tax=Enterovibrio gelatinilyticus TaxID=2899819 RepID=A0ABT5R7V4_9GAMM|nr:sulfurtransferase complex subunit TusB [Enterovibrio sp. ZSDZ42]MDD1796359.1 sulfurtransferase complex subunit TusB [Enterovibrio sp. ZSDZ42]
MMLHTVSSSPFSSSSLSNCLRYSDVNSEILLIEDAVIAAIDSGQWQQTLTSCGRRIYVLREDVVARGINEENIKSAELVDIKGFVSLTERHVTQMKW